MSSILLIWFNYFCLHFVNLFSSGSILSSKISKFLLWPNELYPAVRLMNVIYTILVFLYPTVSMSRFHSRIKVIELYILSVRTVFQLNLVSKHCSEFPVFVKTYFWTYALSLFIWYTECQIRERINNENVKLAKILKRLSRFRWWNALKDPAVTVVSHLKKAEQRLRTCED
jgi:hypothetical protein